MRPDRLEDGRVGYANEEIGILVPQDATTLPVTDPSSESNRKSNFLASTSRVTTMRQTSETFTAAKSS
jgi:hypothetical protein